MLFLLFALRAYGPWLDLLIVHLKRYGAFNRDRQVRRVDPEGNRQLKRPALIASFTSGPRLRALEIAQDRFFEEIELLLQLAGRLRQIYELGTDDRKVAVIKLVASNAVLDGRNARLNLFPPFQVLAKARGHTRWLGIINDLRTALKNNPLPVDTLRELLERAA